MAKTEDAPRLRLITRSVVAWKIRGLDGRERTVEVRWSAGRMEPKGSFQALQSGDLIIAARLSCLHWRKYDKPRPAGTVTKSWPCMDCGSTKRPPGLRPREGRRVNGLVHSDPVQGRDLVQGRVADQKSAIREAIERATHEGPQAEAFIMFVETALEARTLPPKNEASELCYEKLDTLGRKAGVILQYRPEDDWACDG